MVDPKDGTESIVMIMSGVRVDDISDDVEEGVKVDDIWDDVEEGVKVDDISVDEEGVEIGSELGDRCEDPEFLFVELKRVVPAKTVDGNEI